MKSKELGELAEAFEQHRQHAFAVAYRMLGSVADAEDVVQDAWLKFRDHGSELEKPRAWLTRVVSRRAIDQLRAQKRARERYTGPWLPTPWVTDAPQAESVAIAESVSMAFLVLLEQLGPVERVVFLLRSVFDRDYDEIAEIVGKSAENCRQIHARSRKRIEAGRPRFEVANGQHLQVVAAFAEAAQRDDVDSLLAVLDPEVELISDGGGKIEAALKPVVGAEKVIKFLAGVRRVREGRGETTMHPCMVNARLGGVVRLDGKVDSTISFDIVDGRIVRIHVVRNPDKLTHLE